MPPLARLISSDSIPEIEFSEKHPCLITPGVLFSCLFFSHYCNIKMKFQVQFFRLIQFVLIKPAKFFISGSGAFIFRYYKKLHKWITTSREKKTRFDKKGTENWNILLLHYVLNVNTCARMVLVL